MFKKLIVLFSVLLFCAGTIFAQEEEADGTDAIVKVDGTAPADQMALEPASPELYPPTDNGIIS